MSYDLDYADKIPWSSVSSFLPLSHTEGQSAFSPISHHVFCLSLAGTVIISRPISIVSACHKEKMSGISRENRFNLILLVVWKANLPSRKTVVHLAASTIKKGSPVHEAPALHGSGEG